MCSMCLTHWIKSVVISSVIEHVPIGWDRGLVTGSKTLQKGCVIMTHEERHGRKSELLTELDNLIDTLKSLVDRCENKDNPPPEDLRQALQHARHVRDLVEQDTIKPKKAEVVMAVIRFASELAKTINDYLICIFTGVRWIWKLEQSSSCFVPLREFNKRILPKTSVSPGLT